MTAIQFSLNQWTCISGQSVQGRVLLDFRAMRSEGMTLDEVIVKPKGDMHIQYGYQRSGPNAGSRRRKRVELTRRSRQVWRRGHAYPPAGSDTLVALVSLPLAEGLPPSCNIDTLRVSVSVRYQIEAVGVRSGVFHPDAHVKHMVTILPTEGVDTNIGTQLKNGWKGDFITKSACKYMNKWLVFGDRAEVRMQLSLPNIPTIPTSIAIGFSLSVITFSQPCQCDEVIALWINPPSSFQGIEFTLKQSVCFRGDKDKVSAPLTLNGTEILQVEKEWSQPAGDMHKGRWRQETLIKSSFTLRCPPTFRFRVRSSEVEVSYVLRVKVRFGAMRSLGLDIPVTVVRDIA